MCQYNFTANIYQMFFASQTVLGCDFHCGALLPQPLHAFAQHLYDWTENLKNFDLCHQACAVRDIGCMTMHSSDNLGTQDTQPDAVLLFLRKGQSQHELDWRDSSRCSCLQHSKGMKAEAHFVYSCHPEVLKQAWSVMICQGNRQTCQHQSAATQQGNARSTDCQNSSIYNKTKLG